MHRAIGAQRANGDNGPYGRRTNGCTDRQRKRGLDDSRLKRKEKKYVQWPGERKEASFETSETNMYVKF